MEDSGLPKYELTIIRKKKFYIVDFRMKVFIDGELVLELLGGESGTVKLEEGLYTMDIVFARVTTPPVPLVIKGNKKIQLVPDRLTNIVSVQILEEGTVVRGF